MFRPAQLIGVVDVAEVYRQKEAEFASLITAGKTEAERQRAMDLAATFARGCPRRWRNCRATAAAWWCSRARSPAHRANTVDLTAQAEVEVGAP